jgi:hypothetical protein
LIVICHRVRTSVGDPAPNEKSKAAKTQEKEKGKKMLVTAAKSDMGIDSDSDGAKQKLFRRPGAAAAAGKAYENARKRKRLGGGGAAASAASFKTPAKRTTGSMITPPSTGTASLAGPPSRHSAALLGLFHIDCGLCGENSADKEWTRTKTALLVKYPYPGVKVCMECTCMVAENEVHNSVEGLIDEKAKNKAKFMDRWSKMRARKHTAKEKRIASFREQELCVVERGRTILELKVPYFPRI